jgi:precorrin-3B methylase
MTQADADLKALFAETLPPAMDARFRLAVLERMERRRAAVQLAVVIIAGLAATAGAAMLGPQLSEDFSHTALIVISLLIAAAATGWGVVQMRRPI